MTASFFIPTRGTCMSLVNRQGYESALVAAGRILEHRLFNPSRIVIRGDSGSAALPHSWRSRPSSTWDACRIVNFSGAIGLHSLFRALVKPLQKSASCVTQLFHSLLCVGLHDQQRSERNLSCVTSLMSRVTKCL